MGAIDKAALLKVLRDPKKRALVLALATFDVENTKASKP
jgi:hypothetical protein